MSKPRILYLGYYRGSSGYSRAAAENIMALRDYADLACRNYAAGQSGKPIYAAIAEYEKVKFQSYDYIIQHFPPYSYISTPEIGKSIGIFYCETDPIPATWMRSAKLMDGLLLPNKEMTAQYVNHGLYDGQPVALATLPSDISRYTSKQTVPKKISEFKDGGRFLFYTVGELVVRKNVQGLVKAFVAEFGRNENVGLVIKSGGGNDTRNRIAQLVHEVERGSKLYNHAPVFAITDNLTDKELDGLHDGCDCYVQPSHSESISIPAMDALGFGKTPIVTNAGGFLEYVDDTVGWLIPARKAMVFGEGAIHGELFTSKKTWWEPDLLELRSSMRQAFTNRIEREEKASRGFERAYDLFSYETVGPQIIEALSNVTRQKVSQSR